MLNILYKQDQKNINLKDEEEEFEVIMEWGRKYGAQKYLIVSGERLDLDFVYQLSLKSDNFYKTIGFHPCFTMKVFEGKMKKNHEKILNKYLKQCVRLL